MHRFSSADNRAMLRFLKETWLPTSAFGVVAAWFALVDAGSGVIRYPAVITALVVVPFVWKSFVVRQGRPHARRASLAGAASAFLIVWSDFTTYVVRSIIDPSKYASEELGGLLVILFIPMILVSLTLGAGIGWFVAYVQAQQTPGPPQESETSDVKWDGAIGGALVATVAAPFAAIPATALIHLYPGAPGLNYSTITTATWLLLVSIIPWLGVIAVRDRERSQAAALTAGESGSEK
jgi:hypothetical protein